MCVYVCVFVCVHVFVCVYVCVCVFVCVHVFVCAPVSSSSASLALDMFSLSSFNLKNFPSYSDRVDLALSGVRSP